MEKQKIIDSHAHIFPSKIALKAVENIGSFYGIRMKEDGTTKSLIKSAENLNAEKVIVNSSATKPTQVRAINEFINRKISKTPLLCGLISLHPDLSIKQIDEEIEYALENGFKGVKLHPDFQKFYIDDKKAENIYSALSGVLPILFHVGDNKRSFSEPHMLVKILKKYPKLRAIAAHLGGYTKWTEVDCYKDIDNCFFDTSSALCFMEKDLALKTIYKLGVDKILFGSDYPMSNAQIEYERFKALSLDLDIEEKILYKTAKEFYNL